MSSSRQFKIDLAGLITLLAKNLYTEPDVFVRELLQNAQDSITRRRAQGVGFVPRVTIRTDRENRTVTFSDNGCGLSEDEVDKFVATIARSGTRQVRTALEQSDRASAEALIGQFGIGLLSAFIVATHIELDTLTDGSSPVRWLSDGGSTYELEESQRSEIGTAVTLTLRPEYQSFLDESRIIEAVRRYADYLGTAVHLNAGTSPVNAVNAPWHRWNSDTPPDLDECFSYWERRFMEERSLLIFPVDEEFSYTSEGVEQTGTVQGILAITDRHSPDVNTRGTVDLFIRRVFIAGGLKNILPQWARFIQGVLECNSLVPNAARDNVMANDALAQVTRTLDRLVLGELRNLSVADPLRFKEIMRWHSYSVLSMAVRPENAEFFREIADIVPLRSDAGALTMPEYIAAASRRTDGTAVVHYIRERQSANQYFMLCQARGLRVFDCSENYAERFIELYSDTWPERVKLNRVDVSDSDVIFSELDAAERARFAYLENEVRHLLTGQYIDVQTSRFSPEEIPAIITSGRGSKARQEAADLAADPSLPSFLRQKVDAVLRDTPDSSVLHLNASARVVERLAQQGPTVGLGNRPAIAALINNASLLSARQFTPEVVSRMFSQYGELVEQFVSQSETIGRLESKLSARESELIDVRSAAADVPLTRYVQCFVAMDFKDDWAASVYRCVRTILEGVPFHWRVLRADDQRDDPALWSNTKKKILESHCFVGLLGGENFNVAFELGRIEAIGRPVLLLNRKGSRVASDLGDRLFVEVDPEHPDLSAFLRDEIFKDAAFRNQVGDRYLSAVSLEACGVSAAVAKSLMESYSTWQDLFGADPDAVASRLSLSSTLVKSVQEQLRSQST